MFVPIQDFEEQERNYMEVLGNGNKYDLVNLHSLKIKDVQSKRSLGLYEKKISRKDKLYFLDHKNKKLIEVPRSRKNIYKILNLDPQKKEQISGNIKRTENLIQAVELAN